MTVVSFLNFQLKLTALKIGEVGKLIFSPTRSQTPYTYKLKYSIFTPTALLTTHATRTDVPHFNNRDIAEYCYAIFKVLDN